MSRQRRRFSPWILDQEERLTLRRERTRKLAIWAGVLIALAEALWPWNFYTPQIPGWVHIALAAICLPMVYFLIQTDFQRKLASMDRALDDLGRRLFFLDAGLHSEQFEMQQQFNQGALQPTQRAMEQVVKLGNSRSLRGRMDYYYIMMPSHVLEEDRAGVLAFLHPKTAISWLIAIIAVMLLLPVNASFPLIGLQIGASKGLTLLPLLLVVYLLLAKANSRYAFEVAMYTWMKQG